MSSGSPMRPIIARAARRSSVPCQSAAPRPPCVMPVRTKPGATESRPADRLSDSRGYLGFGEVAGGPVTLIHGHSKHFFSCTLFILGLESGANDYVTKP